MTTLFGTSPTDGLAWIWAVMTGLLVFLAFESERAWRRRDTSLGTECRRPARALPRTP